MRIRNIAGLGAAAWLLVVSTAAADVRLTMQNGRVSLVAKEATLRQILAEWARVGQTRIVNAEKLTGGPVTLELSDVSEQEALDVLLRSISGYLVAPRAEAAPNLSQFDRVILMPASIAPRIVVGPPATGSPVFPQPQMAPPAAGDDNQPSLAPPRGPVFTAFPQPQVGFPQQGAQQGPSFDPQAPPAGAFPPPAAPTATFLGAPTSPAAPDALPSPTAPNGQPAPMGTAHPGEILPPPPQQSRPQQ